MSKPVIFFDVDGVLLDWQASFADYCTTHLGRNITKAHFQECKTYGLQDTGLFAEGEFFQMLQDHEKSPAFSNLQPLVGGQWLYLVKQEGYSLHVLTAGGGGSLETRLSRRQNIALHFPAIFDRIHFMDYRGDKTQFMRDFEKRVGPVMGIVEDKLEHLQDARLFNYRAWGIRDFHNRHSTSDDISWFNTTAEACIDMTELREICKNEPVFSNQ